MADFSALKTAIQTYIKQNGNEEITGEILQEILLSVVTTLGDSAINDLVTALANEVAARQNADGTLQQNITNEATARGNADTALQGLIDGITGNIENGYVYAGIATPSSTPATGKVFYLALTAGTYTNFGSTEVSQGINILKYNGSAWSLDAFIGIDDTPTPNSPKLVKSGGAFESVMANGSAFDISAHFASGGTLATYADLSAALTALDTLSASYKRGGMSIKFVQSSDNIYVQYLYHGTSTAVADFTNTDNWEKTNLEKELDERTLFVKNIELVFLKENKKILVPSGDVISYNDGTFWVSGLVDISVYNKLKITASSTWGNCVYAFYNSDESINTIYRSEETGTYIVDEEVSVPIGAKYIRISGIGGIPEMNITTFVKEVAKDVLQAEIDDIVEDIDKPTKLLPIEFAWRISKAINGSNGVITDIGDSDYKVGYYVPVIAGEKYYITGNSNWGNAIYAFYDSNKTFVSALRADNTMAGSGIVDELVTIPNGVSYVCLACNGKYNMAINKQGTSPKREFNGKKWGAVGDSLTDVGAATQIHYFDYIALKTGITPINYGISGTGYAKTSPFYQRVASMISDLDVITAFGSGNDNTSGLQLGEPTDTGLTTICGYINKFITEVKDKYPTKPLGIISPTPWNGCEPSDSNVDATWFKNYTAALKSICELRGIPFLDLYHSSQLHPSDATFRNLLFSKDGTYTSATESTPNAIQVTSESLISVRTCGLLDAEIGDWVLPNLNGVHPNEIGHRLIASQICSFIESLVI